MGSSGPKPWQSLEAWKGQTHKLQIGLHAMKPIENNKDNPDRWIRDPSVRLLTMDQAALYLGRSIYSLREMVYGRVFPVIQAGSRSKIWLDRVDLDNWIGKSKELM